VKLIVSIFLSYIIGGIPVGFIIGKAAKKIDIRRIGSMNIGATNVFHKIGKIYGIVTFLLDMVKPIFVMWLADVLSIVPTFLIPFLGAVSVVGNLWSPFLKFKGGRGLSTTIGYFLYTMPRAVPVLALITFLIVMLTKWNLPVGGLSLYIVGPIIAGKIYHYPRFVIMTTLFLGFFILIRQLPWMIIHLANFYNRRRQQTV
jgi:glycerol-3-phosphate acyltransferase PlsY